MERERLNCDTILATPQDFDWSEGFDESWELVYPEPPEDTRASVMLGWLDDEGGTVPFAAFVDSDLENDECDRCEEPPEWELDGQALCEEHAREIARDLIQEAVQDEPDKLAPMMNYLYPLPDLDNPGEAQWKLMVAPLPLVVVQVGEDNRGQPGYGLALSGGGMDLSWEICAAYRLLGYLPPFHFCDLPRMAGKPEDEDDRATLEACAETLRVLEGWIDARRRKLDALTSEDAA